MSLIFLNNLVPVDGGQIYAETDLSRDIVEPWNAISSLFILLPAIYWAVKLYGRYREYPFITLCIPLLFLGGLGSTLFHAFRSSRLLLLLDVTPTAILTLALAVYFWVKALPKWWLAALVVVSAFVFRILVWNFFPTHVAVNLAYAITGILIFIPIIITLFKSKFRYGYFIVLSIIFFCLSLFFRETDNWKMLWIPMGTHFLWHVFSGIGAFFLAEYLYKTHENQMIEEQKE